MNIIKKMSASGWVWLWVTVLVLIIDRYTKFWVLHHLVPYEPVQLFPILNLNLAYNTGAAFSFLHSMSGWQNVVLGSLAGIVSIMILIWLARLAASARWLGVALCLVLGGALGNAWDRILYGFVIDFIDFHWDKWHFAIFNGADSAITVGAMMLIWSYLRR